MADIIDLEEYPEDFDDGGYGRGADRRDKATSSISSSDSPTPEQPRFITIKSYTEICIETGEKVENAPATARAKHPHEDPRKKPRPDAQVKKEDGVTTKKKKPQQRSQRSAAEYYNDGVWGSRRSETRKKDSQTGRSTAEQERVPCWFTVLACCCGVNNEYKWYSLKGKGLCLFVPMFLVYVIVSLVVLPFLTAAALGVAIFACSGVASYLAMASNKVGVSLDESESSCFRTVYGSWV